MSSDEPLHNRKYLKKYRRRLRNNATPAEAQLWIMLRQRKLNGRKFRRQHSIGPFIVDFYCPAERLVVELEGEVHNDPLRRNYDDKRRSYLNKCGINTLYFENRQVFEQPEAVLNYIVSHFDTSSR